jgi:hypothetical protein
MQTETSITLYNKYKDKSTGKEMYTRTIIKKATWHGGTEATVSTTETSKGTVNMAKAINIRIPIYFGNDFGGGKTYIDEKAWNKLSDDDKLNKYFTFQEGDRVVKGECTYEFSATNPITNLNIVDNVVSIMVYKVNDYGSKFLQHYYLGGK